jgi:hypothetical protein
VRPVERDRLTAAEPAPGAVVPPGSLAVEGGRDRQRQDAARRYERSARGRLARPEAGQPEPAGHEQQQQEPPKERLPGVVLRDRGPVEDQQHDEARRAQPRRGPARREEGERGGRGEQAGRAEHDRAADPLVGAVVGPVDALDTRQPAVEAVDQLAVAPGRQQAQGQAGHGEPGDQRGQDCRASQREHGPARQA